MLRKRLCGIFILISIILLSSCDGMSDSIAMPNDSEYYTTDYDGTVANLCSHFKEMGFKNVGAHISKYTINTDEEIVDVTINGKKFDKNDKFKSNDTVLISHYEYSPFLHKVLTDKTASYRDFLEEFDGQYIEFDGCVQTSHRFAEGYSQIIEISGGNYSTEGYEGLLIRVNVDSSKYENDIIKDVEVGANVRVVGKVSEYHGEYFKMIYIEAIYLQYR